MFTTADIFTFVVGSSMREVYLASTIIKFSNGNNISSREVKKGSDLQFNMIIVDPNFAWTEHTNVTDVEYFVHGDSFIDENARSTSVKLEKMTTEATSIGGKLTFALNLPTVEYTGTGRTLKVDIEYKVNGRTYYYTFSRSVAECIEYVPKTTDKDDDDDVTDKDLDPLIPNIIVSNYNYGSQSVVANANIDLKLEFKNTSQKYDLENIVMKIDSGEGFSITNSSNSYFIDSLKVGQALDKVISLQALPTAKAQSYPISVNFTFQYVANDVRKSGTSAESISIPITQPDRFSVNELQLPTMLHVGDEYPISIGFVNKGKGEIYNVTAELRGNLSNNGERQFVGNVASGTESSADFYISAQEEGAIVGELIISYEDSNSNLKEVVRTFSIEVQAYYDPWQDYDPTDPVGPVVPEEPTSFWTPKTVGLSLAFAVVVVMCGYTTVLNLKAKRSDMLDEDL